MTNSPAFHEPHPDFAWAMRRISWARTGSILCFILAGGASAAADARMLGRRTWRAVTTLLWSLLAVLAAVVLVSVTYTAVTGQVILSAIYGSILFAICFSGPAGAILSASRVFTLPARGADH